MEAFSARLHSGTAQVIEFGGKPFGDYHASRVLPGYEPDIKARILKDIHRELGNVTITLALNAKDVIASPDGRRVNRRIRGDSGLRYDDEVIRLTKQAREQFDLPIESVTLTALPTSLSAENQDYIHAYTNKLQQSDLDVHIINHIPEYPLLDPATVVPTLTEFAPISTPDQHLIVASPGGGSGKFCVAITEIAHKLQQGENPNFIKFETFPVFNLEQNHPLNVAFLAATADLPNSLLMTGQGKTNYDKDVENLRILHALMAHYSHLESPLHHYREPTDMGVNVIETGITNEAGVKAACLQEITDRIERYTRETSEGNEHIDTLSRTRSYLGLLGLTSSDSDQKEAQQDAL